jgi:hypothetical protein
VTGTYNIERFIHQWRTREVGVWVLLALLGRRDIIGFCRSLYLW